MKSSQSLYQILQFRNLLHFVALSFVKYSLEQCQLIQILLVKSSHFVVTSHFAVHLF